MARNGLYSIFASTLFLCYVTRRVSYVEEALVNEAQTTAFL